MNMQIVEIHDPADEDVAPILRGVMDATLYSKQGYSIEGDLGDVHRLPLSVDQPRRGEDWQIIWRFPQAAFLRMKSVRISA